MVGGAREAELKAGPLIVEEAACEHRAGMLDEMSERDFKGRERTKDGFTVSGGRGRCATGIHFFLFRILRKHLLVSV